MSAPAVIEANDLMFSYGGRPVITGMNFALRANEVLCLIGHNGAGKSTLLKCLFGLLRPRDGELRLDGAPITGADSRDLVARGFAMVPEGRGIFPSLTVREMMMLSMWASGIPKAERPDRLERVLTILPAIREFLHRGAGTLWGGQQQMVSIGRALLSRPRILLLDEPSIGLAPKLFQDLLQPIRRLQEAHRGVTPVLPTLYLRKPTALSLLRQAAADKKLPSPPSIGP